MKCVQHTLQRCISYCFSRTKLAAPWPHNVLLPLKSAGSSHCLQAELVARDGDEWQAEPSISDSGAERGRCPRAPRTPFRHCSGSVWPSFSQWTLSLSRCILFCFAWPSQSPSALLQPLGEFSQLRGGRLSGFPTCPPAALTFGTADAGSTSCNPPQKQRTPTPRHERRWFSVEN